LLFGAHLLIQTWALSRTSVMHAGWIIAFIPAVVAVGAWIFQRRHLLAIGWLGIVIASAGVFVLTATRPAQLADAGVGDLLMLCTTFSWAAYTLLNVEPARRSGGLRVSAGVLLVSVVPTFIGALFSGSWHAGPTSSSIAALLFLGLGASGIAMWAYADAIAELGPSGAPPSSTCNPW
jgi:drug/metabolite transporter (DMT)-like permease